MSPKTSKSSSLSQVQQQVFSARRLFFPEAREPLLLPEQEIEVPPPPQAPPPPPPLNWWTTILPPALMAVGALVGALINAQSLLIMLPMLMMSLGFPIANLLGQRAQRKAYQQELLHRERAYQQTLAKVRSRIEELVQQQRTALEEAYPPLRYLLRIAEAADKRMWSRRPTDEDFLALRIGWGEGNPSFSVRLPPHANSEDPLVAKAGTLAEDFQKLPDLPFLIDLASIGSVAVSGKKTGVYALTYRLVLDLLMHHSPQDVKVFLLGDTRPALQRWEWLKWVPHTEALEHHSPPRLAFDTLAAARVIEFTMEEFRRRRAVTQEFNPATDTAWVLIVDDSGDVRRHPDMRILAERGHEVGIYLLFVGGRDWPRECRARLEALDEAHFRFVETSGRTTKPHSGEYENTTLMDCERVARALAGWTVTGRGATVPLPESIRLSSVLGPEAITVEAIQQAWTTRYKPGDLLRFPIGVYAHRDRLEVATLNLLPAELGGHDAYHAILIGTTGSGKSEFMKSLVFGATIRYPPTLLNFFFMDFKGGAAFNIFADLPHVSGIVTNLSPELVERGLDSIRNEIDRRQAEFDAAGPVGKLVKDIWVYNRLHPERSMPHLILFLDEFARGLLNFPRLREVLDVLVSQGRSLGMYLILANQDVNAHVDKLLNNVGWRIALKVAKPEEIQIIERGLPSPVRAGQGYLRLSSEASEIIEFQAGYAGFPIKAPGDKEEKVFRIYEVEPDGAYREVWRQTFTSSLAVEKEFLPPKEEEFILNSIRRAAKALNVRPAKRIYLDPLPATIPFEAVVEEAGIQPAFREDKWYPNETPPHVVAYWGKVDIPELCLQDVLRIDFDEKDGHLWIMGAPQSGLDMALSSLIMSLALRYTPEQVQFYMLELGAGELAPFEMLPHTGAVIYPQHDNPQESERLGRLLNLLDRVFQERSKSTKSMKGKGHPRPALFVLINSFGELRANFPEEADRLTRFVRDGGRLGIHFIITSARGPELTRSISNMIARRLVLQLVSKDDYLDIIGKPVSPLTKNIPGRGYWVDDGIAIAQVATPPANVHEQIRAMQESWHGATPEPMEILPSEIPLSDLLSTPKSGSAPRVLLPVGRSYETLETVAVPLEENPTWLILGPRESGKSNFLACAARCVVEGEQGDEWAVRAYVLRRSPLAALQERFPRLRALASLDEIVQDVQQIIATLQNGKTPEGKRLLLLIDDLGFAFQPGRETLAQAFNELGRLLAEREQVVLMASGLLDELRMQLASPLVKLLRQNRTGLVLSQNTSEADWLGASIPLAYRRMDLPLGRGFFIHKGRLQLVQTPRWEK